MVGVKMTWELSQQRNDVITYFNCSRISRHWEVFFEKKSCILSEIYESVIEMCQDEVYMVRNSGKKILMFGRQLQKTKRFSNAVLPNIRFILFKDVFEKIMGIALADCKKGGFDLHACIEILLFAISVNILGC